MFVSYGPWIRYTEPIYSYLNNCHPAIKFILDYSSIEIAFLNLIIYKRGHSLLTRLYTKPADRHLYLHYTSDHEVSLKNSIPYSQFLRLKRTHSENHHLLETNIHMYSIFWPGGTHPTSYSKTGSWPVILTDIPSYIRCLNLKTTISSFSLQLMTGEIHPSTNYH